MTLGHFLSKLGRPVAYFPEIAKAFGSVKAGVFLCQLMYWYRDGKKAPEEWVWKTQAEWHDETALSRREQETARHALVKAGVLEEQRKGVPARMYFHIKWERFDEVMTDHFATEEIDAGVVDNSGKDPDPVDITPCAERESSSMAESAILECAKAPIKKRESAILSIAETTPKTTHLYEGESEGENANFKAHSAGNTPRCPDVFEAVRTGATIGDSIPEPDPDPEITDPEQLAQREKRHTALRAQAALITGEVPSTEAGVSIGEAAG